MTTRIFLSYGRGDDDPDFYDPAKSFMRRLYNGLKAAGFEVWWDRESLPSRALSFLQEIRDAITAADKLVLIVGEKGMASDYVRAEWEYALSICKTVVPILTSGDYSVMPPEIAFANAPDFRDLSLFDQKLAELIRLLNEDDAPMGKLYNVSDLPRGYIERKVDMQAVSAMIRSDAVKPTVVTAVGGRAAALYGLGGIGKTVLTRALCYDCDLRRSFPDGVIWLEIGKTPVITSRQADIGEIFGDSRDKYTDEQAGKTRLAQMLYGKKVLLILDDVWESQYVEFFRAPSHTCRLLVTTRNQRLANGLGANNYELDKLSEEQGIQLIAARFGKNPAEIAELETLREIVNLLDGHTLAISIAATQLREQSLQFASRLLERMRKRRDGDNPFKDLALEESDKNLNLELSLSLSYDDLKPDLQRRFRALGVLTPDGSFDTHLAAAIWNDTEENLDDTEDALNNLVQKGLLVRENPVALPPDDSASPDTVGAQHVAPSLRFSQHNLLRAYTRALLTRSGEIESHFTYYADHVIKLTEEFGKLTAKEWGIIDMDVPHLTFVGGELESKFRSKVSVNEDLERRALKFCLGITLEDFAEHKFIHIVWFEMGQELCHQRGDLQNEAMFLKKIGSYYSQGDKNRAIEYYKQSLLIYQSLKNFKEVAIIFGAIGAIHAFLGETARALDFYNQSLLIDHETGDQLGSSTTLNNIGYAYFKLGNAAKASEFYEKALESSKVKYDRLGEASVLNNLGSLYSYLGEKERALGYYEDTLRIDREMGNQSAIANSLNNIAGIYFTTGDLEKANDIFAQIASIYQHQDVMDAASEATFRRNRGIVLQHLNNIEEAIAELQQSITVLKQYNLPHDSGGIDLEEHEALLAFLRRQQ